MRSLNYKRPLKVRKMGKEKKILQISLTNSKLSSLKCKIEKVTSEAVTSTRVLKRIQDQMGWREKYLEGYLFGNKHIVSISNGQKEKLAKLRLDLRSLREKYRRELITLRNLLAEKLTKEDIDYRKLKSVENLSEDIKEELVNSFIQCCGCIEKFNEINSLKGDESQKYKLFLTTREFFKSNLEENPCRKLKEFWDLFLPELKEYIDLLSVQELSENQKVALEEIRRSQTDLEIIMLEINEEPEPLKNFLESIKLIEKISKNLKISMVKMIRQSKLAARDHLDAKKQELIMKY